MDEFQDLGAGARLLDAGCVRGGTSFVAHRRFGRRIEGVSISEQQIAFARRQASVGGVAGRVDFHFRNMLDNGFDDASFDLVWNNESTMYVDLHELFREHARSCVRAVVTSVSPVPTATPWGPSRRRLPASTGTTTAMCTRAAPTSPPWPPTGLIPIKVLDLTADALPYWELRAQSPVCTGVEEDFLTSYRERSMHYLLIVADRVR